jgi:glutamyl-tRNA reductase
VPIITEDMVEKRKAPRFWFDLAIPRDIETPKEENIKLFVIDDLQEVIKSNIADRKQYVRQAQAIIGRSVVEFFEWLDALNVEPIIKEIYQKAYKAAAEETQRAVKKGFIPKEYENEARKLAEQALKRFLHDMTKKMREVSHEGKSDTVTGAFQYILNDEKDNIPDKYKHLAQKEIHEKK